MSDQYSVQIVARGQGLTYREGQRTLNFFLWRNRETGYLVFHPYASYDSRFRRVELSSVDHKLVVNRIVDCLESRGEKVRAEGERPPNPPRDHQKENEESLIQTIMEKRSLSESAAREWWVAYQRRRVASREKIYNFLKAHSARAIELEESGDFSGRIWQLSCSMQVSEAAATALVISGEVISDGQMALLRKDRRLRKKSTHEDIQEMLGVTVPIPQDVWNALGLDNV